MPTVPFCTPRRSLNLREINNGILKSKNAMPNKDITSDDNATFSSWAENRFKKTGGAGDDDQHHYHWQNGDSVVRELGLGDHAIYDCGPGDDPSKTLDRWQASIRSATKRRGMNAIGKQESEPRGHCGGVQKR
jgi:hypothetical protein